MRAMDLRMCDCVEREKRGCRLVWLESPQSRNRIPWEESKVSIEKRVAFKEFIYIYNASSLQYRESI